METIQHNSFPDPAEVWIILVNYNGYADTLECVQSIKRNHYPRYRVVIVDNASPDGSGVMLEGAFRDDPRVHVILNGENAGFAAGNNLGMRYAVQAGAEAILLMNNDTVADENFLTELLQADADNAILTGKIRYYAKPDTLWYAGGSYDCRKGTVYHRGDGEKDRGQYDTAENTGFVCGCFLFMRVQTLRSLGYLPEKYFLYSEDLAYSLKALSLGIRLRYIPGAVLCHKVSAACGRLGSLQQYYIIRNRLMIIHDFHRGINKWSAYGFTVLHILKRLANGEYSVRAVCTAVLDYLQKSSGRRK